MTTTETDRIAVIKTAMRDDVTLRRQITSYRRDGKTWAEIATLVTRQARQGD